ncbi:MAG: hypothetical protein JNK82_23780 [Myxococcaceae bacterium]|nr:hypothetical protein [Myxococcaceae bacterium]
MSPDATHLVFDAARPRSSPALRTVLTSLFVLFMLASAHLLMVVINAAEHAWSPPLPAEGPSARMFNDRPLAEELELLVAKARVAEHREVLAATLARVRAGDPLEVKTLPVTRFLVWVSLLLVAAGAVLLWLSARLKSDATQSILGIFAGNLLWTGGVEYGLVIAARALGIGKSLAVVDGAVVATYGEYVLLKHTWGPLLLIIGYIAFLESSRCPLFLWPREKLRLMRGATVSGRIDNYGPRSAFQYSTTVWAFYLLLLWAYDDRVAGVHSLFTQLLLVTAIAGSLYCVKRLHEQTGWGPAVRYAVGAMIVVWTPIEVLGKWGVLREPWLLLRSETLLVFFGGLALGTVWLWRAQRRAPRDTPAVPAPEAHQPPRLPPFGTRATQRV